MAMQFFEHQEQARKATRRLVLLFLLAVVAIVIAVNVTLGVVWIIGFGARGHQYVNNLQGWHGLLPRHFFVYSTLLVLAFIAGGTLWEMWNLREGGDAVAEMAGGRLLESASRVPAERRLLNIVEEMSLASGVSMPRVYVLDGESAINAFAAGFNPNEAVIAVTAGALSRLSRDELQGVIGHEFSHILNGDMRLNLRLMGVLSGILVLAMIGQNLMDVMRYAPISSRRRDDDSKGGGNIGLALFVGGLLLWLVGYIGVFFGRLIKSAVSRQREFLADASAVQFTRNPEGIGGALRKIGGLSQSGLLASGLGSNIDNPNAERLSHLFLGAARPNFVDGMMATHPPVEERVRRIYGRSMPLLDASEMGPARSAYGDAPVAPAQAELAPLAFAPTTIAAAAATAAEAWSAPPASGNPPAASVPSTPAPSPTIPAAPDIPDALRAAVRDPVGARAYVLALVAAPAAAERVAQFAAIRSAATGFDTTRIDDLMEPLSRLAAGLRLPLLDLAMPALKQLSDADRAAFLAALDGAVMADGRVTLSEFVLQTVVARRLDARAGRVVPIRYNDLQAVSGMLEVVLSVMANVTAFAAHTSDPQAAAEASFGRAVEAIAVNGIRLLARESLSFESVRAALEQLNMLAPLRKPVLVKGLAAAARAPAWPKAPQPSVDLLRAICAALDVPMPPELSLELTSAA